MPLVTLTCADKYYPPDSPASAALARTTTAGRVVELAESLPRLLVEKAKPLRLDLDTPEAAVQVDIQKFHALAVNNVELWIRVELTEEMPEAFRINVRIVLEKLLSQWFKKHGVTISWALDIFFGPGHGCYTNSHGKIEEVW